MSTGSLGTLLGFPVVAGPREAERCRPGQLLTLNEVAERLSVGRAAVYEWIRDGKFPRHEVELTADVRGRRWREITVLRFIDARQRAEAQPD